MVSIDCIERGVSRYVDEELIPNLNLGGAKGFAFGMASSLFVKRGGNILRWLCQKEIIQQMGLVSADGSIDLDAIRDAAKQNIPQSGLAVELPMGILIRINAADVDRLYDMIRKEASV